MTMLKKLNKGIALAVAAVLVIVGYYAFLYIDRIDDRQEMRSLIAELYTFADESLVTPADKLSFDSQLSYSEAARKEVEFGELLDRSFTSDALYSKDRLNSDFEQMLDRQLDSELRIKERKTLGIRLTGVKFKGDMAYGNVSFYINAKLEKRDLTNADYSENESPVYNTVPYDGRYYFDAYAAFKRVDGEWKIASLEDDSLTFTGYDY